MTDAELTRRLVALMGWTEGVDEDPHLHYSELTGIFRLWRDGVSYVFDPLKSMNDAMMIV